MTKEEHFDKTTTIAEAIATGTIRPYCKHGRIVTANGEVLHESADTVLTYLGVSRGGVWRLPDLDRCQAAANLVLSRPRDWAPYFRPEDGGPSSSGLNGACAWALIESAAGDVGRAEITRRLVHAAHLARNLECVGEGPSDPRRVPAHLAHVQAFSAEVAEAQRRAREVQPSRDEIYAVRYLVLDGRAEKTEARSG